MGNSVAKPDDLFPRFRSAFELLRKSTAQLGKIFANLEYLQKDGILQKSLLEKDVGGCRNIFLELVECSFRQ